MSLEWTKQITFSKGRFWVHEFDPDSDNSSPQTGYDTKELAAARLLQLMDIKAAITPQDYPERIELGGVN